MTNFVDQVLQRQSELESQRSLFEQHWLEVSRFVCPDYMEPFQNLSGRSLTKGEKNTDDIFDNTAPLGLRTLTSIFESSLTPYGQKWHALTPVAYAGDEGLDAEAKEWFDRATNSLFHYRYAPLANFSHQVSEAYRSCGAFGTGVMLIDKPQNGYGLRYRTIHLAEVFLEEDHQGRINALNRKFVLTAQKAVSMFGEGRLPPRIVQAARSPNQFSEEFTFLHCVKESETPDEDGVYDSYYIEIDTKTVLSKGKYRSFPYAVCRGSTAPGEVYGRSPAMQALPDIKMANAIAKVTIKQAHRIVDPVLLVHDDGVLDTFSLRPGSINYGGVTSDGQPLIHALPTGNVTVANDLLERTQKRIDEAFFVDLYGLSDVTKRMTAFETSRREAEKATLIGPLVSRQQTEFLGPLIHREVTLLAGQFMETLEGLSPLLPPLPESLKRGGGAFSIQYDSPLTRMLRAETVNGLMKTVEIGSLLASVVGPRVFDSLDMDGIMQEVALANAVPQRLLKPPEEVMAQRQARAQQNQVEQAAQLAPGAAAMIKAVNQ